MLSQYNIHECVGHCQQSNLMSYHLALGCVWNLMDVHVNTINTSSWTVYICIRLYTLDLIPEPEHGWIEDKSAFMHVCYMWCMGECLKKNTGYIQTCHLNFVECIWLDYELQSCRNRCWQQLKWHLLWIFLMLYILKCHEKHHRFSQHNVCIACNFSGILWLGSGLQRFRNIHFLDLKVWFCMFSAYWRLWKSSEGIQRHHPNCSQFLCISLAQIQAPKL